MDVFPLSMRRFAPAIVTLVLGALLVPGAASAKMFEMGSTPDNPAPSCPPKDSCRVVTRTTAYEVRANTVKTPLTVPRGGRIVAFTLRVGDMTKKIIHFFNTNYGGTPRVRVVILRKVPHKKLQRSIVAQGGDYHLQPFFGTTAQFALHKSMVVRKGDIVALTVPTWAPILAVGLGTTDQWRASRPSSACDDNSTQTALAKVKASGRFGCTYTTQRMTYTVTLIPTPKRKYDKHQNPIKKK